MNLNFNLHSLMGLVSVEGEWCKEKCVGRKNGESGEKKHPGSTKNEESKISPLKSWNPKALHAQCKADLEKHLYPTGECKGNYLLYLEPC